MAQYSQLKNVTLYGVADENGKLLISPTLGGTIISPYFFLVRKSSNEKWGLIKDLRAVERVEYSIEAVRIFEDVMWFRSHGAWQAINSEGEIVVEAKYSSITQLNNSKVIEAYRFGGGIEYFTVKGNPLDFEDVKITEIGEFESGYALARGYEKKSGCEKFFVISGDTGSVFNRYFDDIERCTLLLQELRNDYVWSVSHK